MPTSYERLLISRFLIPGVGGRVALLIAAIGFAGVTIGMASLVLVVGFMNGAEARLATQIASADGHIFMSARGRGIRNPIQMEERLERFEGVETATASLDKSGLISVNGRSFAADLQGIAPRKMKQTPLFRGKASVVLGSAPTRSGTVALGSDLANQLGIGLGEHASIASIRYDNGSLVANNYDFIVVGIVTTGVYSFDSRRAIFPVNDLRAILNTRYDATKISVTLKDADMQNSVIASMRKDFGVRYSFTTWQSLNRTLFSALLQERLAMTVIISLVTIIALSNILSSMVMLVRYKSREIAILRTMGMSKKSVGKVFVGVGAIIGFTGESAGLAAGLALTVAKDPVTEALRRQMAHPSVELDVLLSLPLAISGAEIAWIVVLVSTGVVLSTLYPALKAAAIDPASVLRYT